MSAAPTPLRTRPVLVTGGAGFIGSNLVDRLAGEGHDVLVYDSLARPGVEANLEWLRSRHRRRLSVAISDVRDAAALEAAVADAQAVFHLAGQVAVTASLADPASDFAVNLQGSFALLDALRRRAPATPLVFASTNKVYGDLSGVPLARIGETWAPRDPVLRAEGIDETCPLDFRTPYGCSKGAADQYVLDFARSYGLRAAVLRMSCIYGPRQMGTEDQGWLAHFMLRAIEGSPITLFGDGCQVRDVLFVQDAVAAYLAAWRSIDAVAGQAFNLGGGPANAVSLRQALRAIAAITGQPVALRHEAWRPGDQRWFVADTRRAGLALGLAPAMPWRQGLALLARALGGTAPEAAPRIAVARA